MASNNYRVRMVRSGEEFEVEGDKKFVMDMFKKYSSGKSLALDEGKQSFDEKTTDKFNRGSSSKGRPLSVGEFIRQLGFKKHTDIVLAFGFYLENYSGSKDFAPADINTCYYDSKLEPSNTSQMIIQNIKRGFFMQAKKKEKGEKRYLLTQSGVDFINRKPKK